MKSLYLIFFIHLIQNQLAAQIKIERYSLEQGLSQSVVLDIVQDNDGFLWIATQDGLNRFDGYEFKVFKSDPNDTTTLSDNWINAIAVGQDNSLWLGTESGGVNRFDLRSFTVKRFSARKGVKGKLQSDIIRDVYEDNKKNVWIATWGGGLAVLKNSTDEIETYKASSGDSASISDNFVRAIHEDHSAVMWVGTKNGLNRFDKKTKTFSQIYTLKNNNRSLTENFITSILKDSKNRLWIGTREGLNVSGDNGKTFTRINHNGKLSHSISDNVILTVFEDSKQNIWVGTYSGGISKLISDDYKFLTVKTSDSESNTISGNYIRTIFEDHSGLIWAGTWGNGLNRLNLNPYKFSHVSVSENGLNHKFVRTFYQDADENLYIGTLGAGVNVVNAKTAQYSYLQNEPNKNSSLTNNDIYSMAADKNGLIWIGTNSGLNNFNPKTGKITRYPKTAKEFPQLADEVIRSVISDSDQNIWIGSRSGIFKYDVPSGLFSTVKPDSLSEKPNISQLFISKRNELWVVVRDNGVFRYSLNGQIKFIRHYKDRHQDQNTISHNNILHVFEDSFGFIWLGSAAGLNKIDLKTETNTRFSKKDGLPNDVIYGIIESVNGVLWISTNSGLSKYTPNQKNRWGSHFRNYDVTDGLQSNEFNTGSVFKTKSGELLFGGINGYNRFNPDEINDNPFVPPVKLTTVKILDHDVRPTIAGQSPEIVFNYDQKVFSFEMSALDFTRPEKNQYAYKLTGFDDIWNFSGNRRFAAYTNLDPGNYELQIIGSNNDGIWNENGERLTIIVLPPFYMTWWFRILIVLFIIVIPLLIYVNRIQKLLELEKLRVRIASDLHDDVGGSLTKISLHADLIQAGVDAEKMGSHLEKISGLSREVIRTMSDIVWAIDARNDTVGNMIDRMRDFATGISAEKNIRCNFTTKGLQSDKQIKVDLRQSLYLIGKEAVNNSIKYSGASEINVSFWQKDEQFCMTISDNGKGMPEVTGRTGHGLKNMQMRAERIGAAIEFKSDHGFEITVKRKAL